MIRSHRTVISMKDEDKVTTDVCVNVLLRSENFSNVTSKKIRPEFISKSRNKTDRKFLRRILIINWVRANEFICLWCRR